MPTLRSSFCDRAVGEVERIITGPIKDRPVHICNECVGVCVDILRRGHDADEVESFMPPRPNLLNRLLRAKSKIR